MAIEDFIIEKMVGINLPDVEDDTNTYQISPQYTEQLNWLTGRLDTVNGKIGVHWEIQNGIVNLKIDVPTRTRVHLILKNGESMALQTGSYQLNDVYLPE